jgi:hypothetical protein
MKNEKESSPSGVSLLLLLLILVTAGVIILKDKSEIEQLRQKQSALFENIEVRDSLINDMISNIGKVEQKLNLLRENRDVIIPVTHQTGKNKNDILFTDAALINQIPEINSSKPDELCQFCGKSDLKTDLLKNEIEQLNKLIDNYKISIQKLRTDVDRQDSELAQNDKPFVQFKTKNVLTTVMSPANKPFITGKKQ